MSYADSGMVDEPDRQVFHTGIDACQMLRHWSALNLPLRQYAVESRSATVFAAQDVHLDSGCREGTAQSPQVMFPLNSLRAVAVVGMRLGINC